MTAVRKIQELIDGPEFWGWVEGMYLAGNDCGIALRLKAGQDYEPQSRKLWREICKGAELVIDVGAHTGIYSLDAWKAGAKNVCSIEPYHLNFARLVMNLRHAGFDANSAFCIAAGSENKYTQLTVNTPTHYCSSGARIGAAAKITERSRHHPVKMKMLDSLIKREYHAKVAAVKIDTEFAGCEVLKGMTEILSHRPDLILECVENGMGDILKPLGYHFYKIVERGPHAGLHKVEDLIPDVPVTHDSPNRYATVKAP